MRKITMLLIVLVSVTGIGCNRAGQQGTGAKKKLTIAVIPKDTTQGLLRSGGQRADQLEAAAAAGGSERHPSCISRALRRARRPPATDER